MLGDGVQTKSYLHADDCVDPFMMALDEKFWRNPVEVYNIGSEDQANVLTIAKIVTEIMGLSNVTIRTMALASDHAPRRKAPVADFYLRGHKS